MDGLAAPVAGGCECVDRKVDFIVNRGIVGEIGAMDCEQPNLLIFACCGRARSIPCESSKSRFCKGCARRYRARVADVAYYGLIRVREKQAFVLTLTAPSGPHCQRRDHHGCNGLGRSCKPCPCSADGFDTGRWNATHTARKNDFITDLRRGAASFSRGKRRDIDLEYFGGVEPQDGHRGGSGRMALHDHLIFVSDADVTFSKAALKKLAMHHGYGHSIHLDVIGVNSPKAERVAAYAGKVSHYIGKAVDERASVPWEAAGENPELGKCWRAWTRSRGWACSMAELRYRRCAHRKESVRPALPGRIGEADALDVLTTSYAENRGPPSIEPVALTLFTLGEREVKRREQLETDSEPKIGSRKSKFRKHRGDLLLDVPNSRARSRICRTTGGQR